MSYSDRILTAKEEVAALLGISTNDITDNGSPIAMGIDSMTLMRLIINLKKKGVDISFTELIRLKTFGDWWNILGGYENAQDE